MEYGILVATIVGRQKSSYSGKEGDKVTSQFYQVSHCNAYQIYRFIGNRRDKPAHLAVRVSRIANPTYIWRRITAIPREPIYSLGGWLSSSQYSPTVRTASVNCSKSTGFVM